MTTDISKYVIKEIYFDEIIDSKTGETVVKFDPPALWWKDEDTEKGSDNP